MTSVVSKISGILQKRFSVITASYVMSTVLGFFSADCHMAIVLTSNAMGRRFDELGIHKCVLARTVHDGATGLGAAGAVDHGWRLLQRNPGRCCRRICAILYAGADHDGGDLVLRGDRHDDSLQ